MPYLFRITRITSLLLLSSLSALAQAQATPPAPAEPPPSDSLEAEVPLWELGFGAGMLDIPDYPAASQRRVRAIALPYAIYRGEIFRIGDGQAARAVAAESDRFELSMSFDAAFDASSEDNRARDGMPDLDYMFEAGPQLIINLGDYRFADGGYSDLKLSLQARGVFSTDFTRLDDRGKVLEPMLRYRHYGLLSPQFDLTVSLRPVWADRRLHAYFYDVPEAFATEEREAFRAESGYFGTHLNFYGTWHMTDKFQLFGGIQTLTHNRAANTDSPLFRRNFNPSFGLGFIWSVLESERTVAPR